MGLQADNKHVLREAIEFYGKGLELKCSDSKLNSILHSNRAHVDALIGAEEVWGSSWVAAQKCEANGPLLAAGKCCTCDL